MEEEVLPRQQFQCLSPLQSLQMMIEDLASRMMVNRRLFVLVVHRLYLVFLDRADVLIPEFALLMT